MNILPAVSAQLDAADVQRRADVGNCASSRLYGSLEVLASPRITRVRSRFVIISGRMVSHAGPERAGEKMRAKPLAG